MLSPLTASISDHLSFKIALLGDSRVGKTSLINCQSGMPDIASTIPTIGANFSEFPFNVESKSVLLQVWDTAGQEMYRSLVPVYLRGAAGVIIVYDQTEYQSFAALPSWLSLLEDTISPETPILIAANKVDLADQAAVDIETSQAFAKSHKTQIFYVSALTGQGVDQLFTLMAELLAGRNRTQVDSLGMPENKTEAKGCDC
jgi:small GTP-binding protein